MNASAKIKKLKVAIVVMLLCAAASFWCEWKLGAAAEKSNDSLIQTVAYDNRNAELDKDIAEQETLIKAAMSGYAISDEPCTAQLSACAARSGVRINKLSATAGQDGTETVCTEVAGSLTDIIDFQTRLQAQAAVIVKNISLRQNGELYWLARSWDKINVLEWLEKPEPDTEEPEPKPEPETQDAPLPTSPIELQLLDQSDMLCYLELEYLEVTQ